MGNDPVCILFSGQSLVNLCAHLLIGSWRTEMGFWVKNLIIDHSVIDN